MSLSAKDNPGRKKDLSVGLTTLVILMLAFVSLMTVLPPILNRNYGLGSFYESESTTDAETSENGAEEGTTLMSEKATKVKNDKLVTSTDRDLSELLKILKNAASALGSLRNNNLNNLESTATNSRKGGNELSQDPSIEKGDDGVGDEEQPSGPHGTGNNNPVVNTPLGAVRGVNMNGVKVFHGVPYAKPPLRRLRWRAPQPVQSWHPNVYDATWVRPGCIQECVHAYCPRNGTSEDCLYMEIYTPDTPARTAPYPVLVYIHGGSFQDMSATNVLFEASMFVKRAKVVVVFMEYRLGVFGFLTTGSKKTDVTGNFGILDQRLALDWVRENIRSFGGDPEQITLGGQSAGAQSVFTHVISDKMTRSKFNRVILQSLPASLEFKTVKKASHMGMSFANRLNCWPNNSVDLKCLQKKSVEEIMNAQKEEAATIDGYVGKYEPWAPVVDGDLVAASGVKGFAKYLNRQVRLGTLKPMIWGITAEEALILVSEMFTTKVPSLMFRFMISILESQADAFDGITALYPVTDELDTRADLARIASDALFRCPRLHILGSLSDGLNQDSLPKSSSKPATSNLWAYTWNRPPDGNLPKEFSSCTHHACHGVDLLFLFQSFISANITPTADDLSISNDFIDYVSNFIWNGNPNHNKGDADTWDIEHTESVSSKSNLKDNESSQRLPVWKSIKEATSEGPSMTELEFSNVKNEGIRLFQRTVDKECSFWEKTQFKLDFR